MIGTRTKAQRLADLEAMHERGTIRRGHIDEMLAELRRLDALNAELVEALELARTSNGRMVMSDPPRDAWKYNRVDEAIREALAKAKEQT